MTDRELFSKACLEAFLSCCDEELEQNPMKLRPSAKHRRCMRYILKYGELPPEPTPRKRILVAALIAAALLLTACAAVIYGEEIMQYWVETYQDHFTISKESKTTQLIEVQYDLGYLPMGYALEDELLGQTIVYYNWVNENGDSLIFTQSTGKGSFSQNNKENKPNEIIIENRSVLHLTDNSYHTYIWYDDEYNYKLYTVFSPEQEELGKIMAGIVRR